MVNLKLIWAALKMPIGLMVGSIKYYMNILMGINISYNLVVNNVWDSNDKMLLYITSWIKTGT